MRRKLNTACLMIALSTFATQAKGVTTPPNPEAYVYVVGPGGSVAAYDFSPTGKLTSITSRPTPTAGMSLGATGKHFITLGTHILHVYKIAANGAIGSHVSQIDTAKYAGYECGLSPFTTGVFTNGGTLDHSGKFAYVLLQNPSDINTWPGCDAYQTFSISSTGNLTYIGDTKQDAYMWGRLSQTKITSDEKFAYALQEGEHGYAITGLKRLSNGELNFHPITVTGPDQGWNPADGLTTHPTHANQMAVILYPDWQQPGYVASYSIDTLGNITTSNSLADMPYVYGGSSMKFNPAGTLLSAYGNGVQLLHWNGTAAPTQYEWILQGINVSTIAWDNYNHLYVGINGTNQLYVFTVTSTSITPVVGSPFSVSVTANQLFVVSR